MNGQLTIELGETVERRAHPPLRSSDWFWRVLVACERSGKVRDKFRERNCNAWSCDLLPQEGEGPHLIEDVLRRLTCCPDNHGPWNVLIAHPPCTYLSVSGMHWTTRGLRDPQETVNAIRFAEQLWAAPIPCICIENPVGVLSTRSKLGKPTQIVQPYEFGDDASKKTCLWLKGLPPLVKDPAKRLRTKTMNAENPQPNRPALPESSCSALLADAAETIEWALGIIEMYDRRLVQLGDPPHLVYSDTHKLGIWKARGVIQNLKSANAGTHAPATKNL